MPERTERGQPARPAVEGWEQSTLALEAAVAAESIASGPAAPSQPLKDALQEADAASDAHTQHAALARVYEQLEQRAIARGRTPVPKTAGTVPRRSDAEAVAGHG